MGLQISIAAANVAEESLIHTGHFVHVDNT